MAFIAKTDYFGLADSNLVCASSSDGNNAQTLEEADGEGEIVAHEVFGERLAPSNTYKVKGAVTSKAIKLGGITVTDSKSVMLGSLSISTSGGSEPTVEASGEEVETSASEHCYFSATIDSLSPYHHAQILFDCASVGGTGCHLKEASYELAASIGTTTVDGVVVASDVAEGKITANLTIVQTGSSTPTVTPGTGWYITAPLACENPDAEYPKWTCTLTQYLTLSTTSSNT